MNEYESLSHSKWDCKYHVVFIPKYRRKKLYHELRQHLGEVFKRLAEKKESRVDRARLPPFRTLVSFRLRRRGSARGWCSPHSKVPSRRPYSRNQEEIPGVRLRYASVS